MFHRCKTLDECTLLYERLKMKLDPAFGGEYELMDILRECYNGYYNHHEELIEKKKMHKNLMVYHEYTQTDDEEIDQNDPRISIIDKILYFIKKKPNSIKSDFTSSVSQYSRRNGYITGSQYNCLVKLYDAFDIKTFYSGKETFD